MNKSKRFVLVGVLLASIVGVKSAETGKPVASLAALRELRQQAAERPRRVIFNNDGNEPVYLCKTTSADEFLSYRTTPLVGSHVDAIFYCTWSSGFGLFTHGTKVGEVFATREGLFARNLAPALLAAGTDPLRVMTEFGRQHHIEIFWSFRLNDTHDGSGTEYGPIMFRANRLKREHPDWLIGSPTQKPKFGAWSAVDFTRAEIRELAFRYVEEVCRNYAVDGVEIDFFRHPVFFKRAAQTGTECNDEERLLMTELIRRIRVMTEVEGLKRGRPILVAMRVPDSVEYCRASGIDLERWLTDGLIDLLITGGYFRLNDVTYSVALGHRHGVKVYASLDDSRVRDETARTLRSSTSAYHGRALEAWQAGADGVYLFNAFNPHDPIWRELGSRVLLGAADQDYFASVLGQGAAAGGAYPHAGFMRIPRLNPASPIPLLPGKPERVALSLGEGPSEERPSPGTVVTLRLQFKRELAPGQVTVTLNGTALAEGHADGPWLEFAVPHRWLKPGANEVQVTLAQGEPANAWTDLHSTVRPPRSPAP